MELTSEARNKLIRFRVATGSPKQLEYFVTDTKRRLKSGRITQGIHDYILAEVAKKEGGSK